MANVIKEARSKNKVRHIQLIDTEIPGAERYLVSCRDFDLKSELNPKTKEHQVTEKYNHTSDQLGPATRTYNDYVANIEGEILQPASSLPKAESEAPTAGKGKSTTSKKKAATTVTEPTK